MTYTIDWRRLLDPGWWHWAANVPLLAAYVAVGPERAGLAFEAALLLCVTMAAFALWRTGEPRAMAVQARLAFAALLVLGLAPAARWFHWVQLAGMTSMVTVGYCPLERFLSLMPWNRRGPLTANLVRATFLTPPAGGGIVRPAEAGAARATQCELSRTDAGRCEDASPCGLAPSRQTIESGGTGRTARFRIRTATGAAGWRLRNNMEVMNIPSASK
jgi:hypothetical protein